MPKTKYLQSREEKRAEMLDKRTLNLKGDLNGVVAKIRAKYGLTQEEFASETGIGRGTLSNRLKNPGSLSLREIYQMQIRFPEIKDDAVKFI